MALLAKTKFAFEGEKPKVASTAVVDNLEIYVDLEGHVDPEAEKKRLETKIKKVEGIIGGIEKKLSNERFVSGAPEHIVAGAKKQLEENQAELKILKSSLGSLG